MIQWLPLTLQTAGAISSGFGGKGEGASQSTNKIMQLPEYPEADMSRKMLGQKVQDWGSQPGYGAISPEWNDIWGRTKNKISQYFWGGPGETGLAGKVKASAASRGVSDSPALQTELTAMGQKESGMLSDAAIEQALQEATFGEQGRQSWINTAMGLSQEKPSFMSAGQTNQPGSPASGGWGGLANSILGGAGAYLGEQQANADQMNWLSNMIAMNRRGVDQSQQAINSNFGNAGGNSTRDFYGYRGPTEA